MTEIEIKSLDELYFDDAVTDGYVYGVDDEKFEVEEGGLTIILYW